MSLSLHAESEAVPFDKYIRHLRAKSSARNAISLL